MSKTYIFLLVLWMVLALANAVSLFVVWVPFLFLNYAFGFYNFFLVLALIPELIRSCRKPKVKEE